jgi:hypothetical protein
MQARSIYRRHLVLKNNARPTGIRTRDGMFKMPRISRVLNCTTTAVGRSVASLSVCMLFYI